MGEPLILALDAASPTVSVAVADGVIAALADAVEAERLSAPELIAGLGAHHTLGDPCRLHE